MKSASFPDAQSLFNMKENDSDRNAGKKWEKQCDLSLSYAIKASFFENNSWHGDGVAQITWFKNAILGRNLDKAVFGNDSEKLKHETRNVKSRTLSKGEIDFQLLMAVAFYDVPLKKSNQLSSC